MQKSVCPNGFYSNFSSSSNAFEIDNKRPARREKSKVDKKKIQNLRLEKTSTIPKANLKQKSMSASVPVGGEEGGGDSSMSPPPNESANFRTDQMRGGGVEMDQDSFMAKLPPNVSSALQTENEEEISPSSEMILRNHEIFLDKGGEGEPKIMSSEEILSIILARSSGEKERVILKSIKPEIEVLPSWSAKRKTQRF